MGRRYSLETIIKKLKEYPFVEKMGFCQKYATYIMEPSQLNFIEKTNAIYPWELEIFAEFSLFADANYATKSIKTDKESEFIKIINVIRNYQHPFLKARTNMDFANAFIMVTGLQQFKPQENILDRLYRYNYFWNFINDKINMPKVFTDNFQGLTYSNFLELGVLIFFYASLNYPTAKIIRYLVAKHKNVVDFLKIPREKYKKLQKQKIDDNFENTIYGFNYLRPYPFIEFQEHYFLPLPYLIIDSITDSLLTRVTYDNNSIRETIGKEVAQSYVETIFKETSIYDEVLPESEYYKGKIKFDTPDILIRKNSYFCLIDTKLSTPKLELRKFNQQAVEKTVLQYAKYVIQVYNRVKDFYNGAFYPFTDTIKVEQNNSFGIVALLEDSYISRRQIYEKVFNELNIDSESDEAIYIKTHIKITNFRDLELFAFRSLDIFLALTKKAENPKEWNDLGLYNEQMYEKQSCKKIQSIENFTKINQTIIKKSIDELVLCSIIKK